MQREPFTPDTPHVPYWFLSRSEYPGILCLEGTLESRVDGGRGVRGEQLRVRLGEKWKAGPSKRLTQTLGHTYIQETKQVETQKRLPGRHCSTVSKWSQEWFGQRVVGQMFRPPWRPQT